MMDAKGGSTNTIEQARAQLPLLPSRKLARARYEGGLSGVQRAALIYLEIVHFIEAGRIEWNVARDGLQMAIDDLDDRFAEESFTWVDDPSVTAWHGGDRGRADETEP